MNRFRAWVFAARCPRGDESFLFICLWILVLLAIQGEGAYGVYQAIQSGGPLLLPPLVAWLDKHMASRTVVMFGPYVLIAFLVVRATVVGWADDFIAKTLILYKPLRLSWSDGLSDLFDDLMTGEIWR